MKRPADFLKELGPEPAPKFDDHPLLAAEIERYCLLIEQADGV